jgi:hypothetical protein
MSTTTYNGNSGYFIDDAAITDSASTTEVIPMRGVIAGSVFRRSMRRMNKHTSQWAIPTFKRQSSLR